MIFHVDAQLRKVGKVKVAPDFVVLSQSHLAIQSKLSKPNKSVEDLERQSLPDLASSNCGTAGTMTGSRSRACCRLWSIGNGAQEQSVLLLHAELP